jgi:hypothetical protein
MATYTWELQGTTDTTIDATDKIQFAGSTFDSAITVGSYNDSTHVESSGGADDSSGNSPHNSKYLTSSTVSIDGGASESLSGVANGSCPIHINFSHGSAVAVTGHSFYAYDGTTTTNAPTGVTFYAAEQGDASWTNAEGSGSAVSVTDSASATSHDFYLLVSASPSSVGEKTAFKLRSELTYS